MKKTLYLFVALLITSSWQLPGREEVKIGNAKDTPAQSLEKIKAMYPGHVAHNQTQPVFYYSAEDRTQTIFEDVYIEVPCDTDGDGKRDLVKIKIIRPAESGIIINPSTGETAITLPVLMEHSPYRNVPGISSEARTTPFHNVRHEQQEADKDYMPVYEDIKTSKPRAAEWYFGDDAVSWNNVGKQWVAGQEGDWVIPASRGDKPVVFQGVNTLTQSNPNPTYQYFLTRGYAIVISSSIGNTFNEDESEGLTNCGDVEETLVPMAIIKWLNGKIKGYTDRSASTEVKATWCNGNVAMTGQSYVGTLPQATACSGVEGLKAILPIAAISNWYDYYRAAGAVVAPYNYQGEDADVLIDVCYGPLMKDFYKDNVDGIRDMYEAWIAQIHQEQDRATGDYNEFWDKRNYLTTVDNVRDDCGIMIMHGLNDWNVKTKQPDQFYRALKNAGKTVKQVWHLGGHSTVWNRYDSHYLAYYHLWLDHFLYGLDNNAVERIPDISIPNANNVNWEFYDEWPIAGSARTGFFLSAPATVNQAGGLLNAPLSGQSADSATFGDNYELNAEIRPGTAGDLTAWENRLFNPAAIDVHSAERLIFATEPLEKPMRINGTVTVTLELAANKGKGTISAVLVESGPNYRAFGTATTDVVLNSGHGEANITLDNYIINNVLSQYKIVTRGYTDVQNPNPSRETYLNAPASNGYIPAFYYRTKQITPGQKYAYTFEMEPMDYTFKAGTRLALYVYSTDYRTTIIPEDVTGFTLCMNENSFVELPVVPTYSIFYHANGGSSLYDDIGGYSDTYPKEGQSVKAANFQAGGYRIIGGVGDSTVAKLNARDSLTFRGWNTKADGSGISYLPNDRIADDQMSDLTLYAQWEETVELLTAEEKAFLALLDYNNVDRLAQYLTKEIGNRYTSTFRRDMAVDWMMAEFTSYGYAPYIHEFENNRYTNNGCFEADGRKYIYYGPAYDTETVYQFTNNTITVTQVEVLNWADVNNAFVIPGGVNVAGKAVIVTLSSVQAPNAAAAAVVPNASNYYDACLALQNAGAKAVIFELPAPRNDRNTTYARIPNTTTGTPVTIPVGVVLHYEIYPMLNSLRNAKEVKLTMQTRNDGKNVLAVLPSATGSRKSVYITAHFDTTVSGPGMNDNASGAVMTLEMARAFKNIPFEYNIVFFLCDAEEAGLRGARAYCLDMTDEDRENFVANYNMDMIATAQADCIHFFLNINDTTDAGASRLRAIQNSLASDQRLIEVPEALALARQREVFNHTYLAAQKLDFDMNFFNICWDTTTDHWAFVQEATRAGNHFPNMMNAVEYDWRKNEKGTSFEALYHKVGDTYETNFLGIAPQGFPPTAPTPIPGLGIERMKTVGDMVSLAIFFSVKGSISTIEQEGINQGAMNKSKVISDADIARQFVVDDMHADEFCTDNAFTLREFAPNSILTNGVIDPFFAKGGIQFFPTDRPSGKGKIYVIAVDFDDLNGEMGVPYGLQRNIFRNQGSIYDLSDPQVMYESAFFGSNGFRGSADYTYFGVNGLKNMHPDKFVWASENPDDDFKGMVQIIHEVSLGKMEIEVVCLNKQLAEMQGLNPETDKWPWFRLDGPMIGYAVQGPADCEDYRQFARLHQAAINAAYRDIQGLDMEDIDFIYTIVPINAFGHRAGLQGGGGFDTSFAYNDQALLQRESEFRHEPGIKTKEGRIVGSAVFGIKNLWPNGNPRTAVNISIHEFLHGMGMMDDYYYGWMPWHEGNSVSQAIYYKNTGESTVGGKFGSDTQDLTSWKKFRTGWIADDEVKVILPGDEEIIYIRALSSYAGDGGNYTDDPGIKTRMVLIPREWRTRDTYGTLWGNGWNPPKDDYNWYDWFTNSWVGGVTRSIKSFPTFYTLESRKTLGADNTLNPSTQGVVISMIANPTWETGNGAGGFKRCTASGLKEEEVWEDPNLGLTITVLESNIFYDKIQIKYTGKATETVNPDYPGPAKHIYQGVLTASDNYVQANDAFTIDFDIFTLGVSAVNDNPNPAMEPTESAPYNNGVVRVATPLGIPGGIVGFEMTVAFDAANFEYVSIGAAPFTYTVNTANVATGVLLITATGVGMIEKQTILSLHFKAKANAVAADYQIKGFITDVTLHNWRGEKLTKGDPGFDGVGTIKDKAGNVSADPLADLYKCYIDEDIIRYYDYTDYESTIFSVGGLVKIGAVPTYTLSGQITCDTPGPVPDAFIGVESEVKLYDHSNKLIAKSKSDWDGYYHIPGVPAGSDYYITAEKPKYFDGKSNPFHVTNAHVTLPELQLNRLTFKVSGAIYAGVNSDGSDAMPLAGAEVYILNIGNAYKVLGGPCITDAEGRYEIDAKVETWNKPFAAVAVKTPVGYHPQMYVIDENLGALALNLGRLYGIDPNDRIYPANTDAYGIGGGYNFLLDKDIKGRDITLTKLQEVHLRVSTKSTEIYYQLRDMEGKAVGAPLQSAGTNEGDDVLHNVPLGGPYYIEVSRPGYISACTAPFTVSTTRVFLRNAFASNTLDLVEAGSDDQIVGIVADAATGKPLEGVNITLIPYGPGRGKSVPIASDKDGIFSLPDPAHSETTAYHPEKDIIFSKEGYKDYVLNIRDGAPAGLKIALEADE